MAPQEADCLQRMLRILANDATRPIVSKLSVQIHAQHGHDITLYWYSDVNEWKELALVLLTMQSAQGFAIPPAPLLWFVAFC